MAILRGIYKTCLISPFKKHKIKRGPIITKGLIIEGTHDPMGPIERGPIERGRMERGRVIIAPPRWASLNQI